jgi:hypothetical protein
MRKHCKAIAALLLPLVAAAPLGCGSGEGGGDAGTAHSSPTVVEHPPVRGWMQVLLPEDVEFALDVQGDDLWLLAGGSAVLHNSGDTGLWKSYALEEIPGALDIAAFDGSALLLGADRLVSVDGTAEPQTTALPDGIDPVGLTASAGAAAVVGSSGELAVLGEGEPTLAAPAREHSPAGDPVLFEGRWAYLTEAGEMVSYDHTSDGWAVDSVPGSGPLAVVDGRLYLGNGGEYLARRDDGTWEPAGEGRLLEGGLVLKDGEVVTPADPDSPIAGAPSIDPEGAALAENGAIWAWDSRGLLVHAAVGGVETRLPRYDAQRITCSLAGQGGQTDPGAGSGFNPVATAGRGAFRIYESVSSRPDPFTEFPPRMRDLRRELSEIAVEELRLVGITLDPVGGDQALVEDASGVSYVLYEDTELANNTHVAEITSNEVVVVQEVSVDYGEGMGEEASIPTIYSMRLHEEGGL